MALLPINKPEKVSKSRIALQQIDLYKNALSGDLIDGGTITNFNSSGIQDRADSTQLTIKNDCVEVAKDLHIQGTVRVENLEYVQAQVPKLNVQKAIMIDHNEVIWKDRLGKSVKKSDLTELGVLASTPRHPVRTSRSTRAVTRSSPGCTRQTRSWELTHMWRSQ